MPLVIFNNAYGTLGAGISNVDTAVPLTAGHGARFPLTAGQWTYATLIKADGTLEVVKVTARSVDSLTVVRGQDGTTPVAFSVSDRIEARPVAAAINDILADGIDNSRKAVLTGTDTYAGTLAPAITAYTNFAHLVQFPNANTVTTPSINLNGLGAKTIKNRDGAAPAVGDIKAGSWHVAYYDGTNFILITLPTSQAIPVPNLVPVRQTVLSMPVDASGAPNPTVQAGTGVGFNALTLTSNVIATAANGFNSAGAVDVVGQSSSLSWTGLTSNGTYGLFADIAGGVLTAVAGMMPLPSYQWGGTYSVAANQFTFNVQAMSGQVGNGVTAAQTNRVCLGEVTVALGVISAIKWYALMRRFKSATTATLPAVNSRTDVAHNLGINSDMVDQEAIGWAVCTTADANYAVGAMVKLLNYVSANAIPGQSTYKKDRNTATLAAGNTSTGWVVNDLSTGGQVAMTAASWSYFLTIGTNW